MLKPEAAGRRGGGGDAVRGGKKGGRSATRSSALNGFNGIYEWITKLGQLFPPCVCVSEAAGRCGVSRRCFITLFVRYVCVCVWGWISDQGGVGIFIGFHFPIFGSFCVLKDP